MLSKELARDKSIGLKGVNNARELGGYIIYDADKEKTVKRGIFLRTAKLGDATPKDIDMLRSKYNLKTIVDFRMDDEIAKAPNPVIDGVRQVAAPVFTLDIVKEDNSKLMDYLGIETEEEFFKVDRSVIIKAFVRAGIVTDDMYVKYLNWETAKKAYHRFIEEILLLPEDGSILFHCTQGKDRTGLAAMLVLAMLGADNSTIVTDYELTNIFNESLISQEAEYLLSIYSDKNEVLEYLKVMDMVDITLMKNVISYLEKEYGSIVGYITQELGISLEDISDLKKRYLNF